RDKRSVALDIRREEGRAILLKLVRRSDVLIENFRPGTMKRLGLSYTVLRRLNRKIVYCSVSGFGQSGPYSRRGGHDAIIHALIGPTVKRDRNSCPLLATDELFGAEDRPIVVAVGNDELWAKLCRIIEREELISDPRFRSNPDRIIPASREILTGILRRVLVKR